ncbi:MAG: tRNA (adenosine(37)-N6)-threonylcarbamoyltransferase complex ATPase subunit type 1 TsaE [Gammaproteobacteria bacterium RIFCSPHIGHO2_12_FULL_41_15]|nr:MAG: tRNA (adenosine(37)-N6)-threonylcarbamoyltransferase complex ATPase subunit type 1 TsaE [Gammaproteobacteria bacterium RIFCSPHIGHO2_12_FULL_41_15]
MKIFLPNEQATINQGLQLAHQLKPGMIVYLEGDLGAGKTTMVRAMLNELGYDGLVKSPSYTLVESYSVVGLSLHHFDLYRLADPEALEYLGLADYLTPSSICLFEWAEKGRGWLPKADLSIKIDILQNGRMLYVTSPQSEIQKLGLGRGEV